MPRRLSAEARKDVVEALLEGAFPTKRFYVLLALATTIASFGLLGNSPAVIIGAMIVAPLMGPILGLSAGMVTGDHGVERRSFFAEVTGVAMAVGLGFLAGKIPLNLGVSDEMLARTAPNAYDLAIAFACGLAGGYASMNRKVSSAIAGVSISVALVPPLATTGLLLALGHPRAAFGAFLLFLANFFCIQLASSLVFGVYGLGVGSATARRDRVGIALRFVPPLLAVLVMGWFMTGTLVALVQDHRREAVVRDVLGEEIARRTGGRLDRILRRDEGTVPASVVASALTPRVLEPSQVREIEARLRTDLRQDVRLIVRSVVSQDVDDTGRVYLDDDERQQTKEAREQAEYLARATDAMREGLAAAPGAELDHVERRDADGANVLVALVRGPEPIPSSTVAALEDGLAAKLGGPVRLIVRSVVSRDTDRQGLLYEAKPEEAPPLGRRIVALRARVRSILERRMRLRPARALNDLALDDSDGPLVARASVSATLPVRPPEVAAIQADLRRYVSPRLRLTVHTVLESDANASGWAGGDP